MRCARVRSYFDRLAPHAITGDERIVEAFRASVRETVGEMEAEMQRRVRKKDAQEDRTTANWAYAEFVYLTSRPVDGFPAPQLHAHAFVFNATYDDRERAWKAGQFESSAVRESPIGIDAANEMYRAVAPIVAKRESGPRRNPQAIVAALFAAVARE